MAKKKKQSVNLARFDADYVVARTEALQKAAEADGRNERMDRYERIYDMKMWLEAPAEGQKRVTSPLGFATVQNMVALLFTRDYTINVPSIGSDTEAETKAQKKEKYLYGLTDLAGLRDVVRAAAWHAGCLGFGAIRYFYDAKHYDDEFPIQVRAPDPRTLFYTLDPNQTRFTELAYAWKRSRREIEDEWGVALTRPDGGFETDQDEQAWLDDDVEYVEYWAEQALEEERDVQGPPELQRMKGVMELVTPPQVLALGAAEQGSMPGVPGEGTEEEEKPKRGKKETVRVRKIVNTCVVNDGEEPQVVKKPVVMPGYSRIPFVFWGGIRTPRPGAQGFLSVLYALTNGSADPSAGDLGILQAINEVLTIDLTITERFANPVAMTDDDEMDVDTTPGAINQTKSARKGLWYVENPGTPPDVPRITQALRDEASRVTIPEVLSGQFVSASGQALGVMSSVFEQVLGFTQKDGGRALGQLYSGLLELTEQYADPDMGWKVWGSYERKDFEDWITPDDIDGDYRVRVKLSANLPRDITSMLAMYERLAGSNKISLDTFLDVFQKLTDEGQDTPLEEKQKILADMAMMQGDLAKQVAQLMAQSQIKQMLIDSHTPPPAPQQAQPQQPPQQQAQPSMAGMPVNPQTMAANGNLQGAMAMPGPMQQQ